jgi:hypothetical protein
VKNKQPGKNTFHFATMLANILLAASTVSLAYTVWMIYQNIIQTGALPVTGQSVSESTVTPANGNNAQWKTNNQN